MASNPKKVLIIYPNWVPSNAVGVLRVRLIVNYLHEYDWEPIVLAVNPAFYEEEKSEDLVKLVKNDIRVVYVDAKNAGKLRLYGDIALRAFGNLKNKAIEIISKEKIDCIWVPIPPFYTALIARKVHDATKVPYVIDYIDPWVHHFPGSHFAFSRAKLASIMANILEPIAVKKAAGFTGVSSAYYLPVLDRNKHLKDIPHAGMPYGFDANDYAAKPTDQKLLWSEDGDVIPYIYAGAFLPNAHYFVEELFKIIAAIRNSGKLNKKVRFYFAGTGHTNLKSIANYAEEYGIQDIVFEKKDRIPYLEVLHNLSNAEGILAIGSTEMHYTASKIFQAILSLKPVFAVFHQQSSVIDILKQTLADNYLVKYFEDEEEADFENKLLKVFDAFLNKERGWNPIVEKLDKYSASSSTQAVVGVLNQALKK